jgi:hypothetical protein
MPAKSPGGLSSGLVWRRSGLALQRLCFPCGCAAFLARQQARYRRPPLTLRPKGCSCPVRRRATAIEAASGGFGQLSGDTTMAQIGTFTRDDNGAYARHDQDPHPQRQGYHQTLRPRQRQGARLSRHRQRSSSAPAGAGPPVRPAPSTSRSSSTIRPSRLRSTPPSFGVTRASTSSSGRDDWPNGAPLTAGRHYSST